MKKHLTCQEGSSNKFWIGELSGTEVTTTWGKIGTDGQSKTKDFDDEEKAKKEFAKLLKEKLGKGYVEASGDDDEDDDEDDEDEDDEDEDDEDEDDEDEDDEDEDEKPKKKAAASAKPAAKKAVAAKTAAKPAAKPAAKAKKQEIYLECTEGGSSKFWKGILDGSSFTTEWGKIGTDGQSKTKEFASAEAAQKEYDKLLKEKLGKGYEEAEPSDGDDDDDDDE
jgi:predicted DNA-binding WGR domain protein